MKVILLDNIKKVGRKHEVKNVSGGYARNFLLPNKLALIANESTEKFIALVTAREEAKKLEREEKLLAMLGELEGKEIHFTVKADKGGSLFAGISKEEVFDKIQEELGMEVNPENLSMEKPIKAVGEHNVSIGKDDKQVDIKVIVQTDAPEKPKTKKKTKSASTK